MSSTGLSSGSQFSETELAFTCCWLADGRCHGAAGWRRFAPADDGNDHFGFWLQLCLSVAVIFWAQLTDRRTSRSENTLALCFLAGPNVHARTGHKPVVPPPHSSRTPGVQSVPFCRAKRKMAIKPNWRTSRVFLSSRIFYQSYDFISFWFFRLSSAWRFFLFLKQFEGLLWLELWIKYFLFYGSCGVS